MIVLKELTTKAGTAKSLAREAMSRVVGGHRTGKWHKHWRCFYYPPNAYKWTGVRHCYYVWER